MPCGLVLQNDTALSGGEAAQQNGRMHVLTNFLVYNKFPSLTNLIIYPANATKITLILLIVDT